MKTELPTPGAVVVGYDGSVGAELALDWAYDQAHLEQRPLEILHATGSSIRTPQPAAALAHASSVTDPFAVTPQPSLLEEAARRIDTRGGVRVRTVLHHGPARAGLVGASRDAAMVVVGATGLGAMETRLLGSVARGVAKQARCPVVVVRRSHATGLRSVLVGTDCDPRSDVALAFAFRVAATRSCPLTVLRCLWDVTRPVGDVAPDETGYDHERSELAGAVQAHAERHPGVEVHLTLARGFADRRLIQATRDHDLVVLGHHTMPLLHTVVWDNVTPLVLRKAAGDVAVVPD